MPLLDLPNEILLDLSGSLESEADINSFAQGNRRLYRLLNTYLYRHNVKQSGSSGLVWAAMCGQEAAVARLLNEGTQLQAELKGLKVAADEVDFGIALQAASYEGHEAIVKLLLDKGANGNAQGGCYDNVLHAASNQGHEAIVKLLLKSGAHT